MGSDSPIRKIGKTFIGNNNKMTQGSSQAVLWLGRSNFTAMVWVQSLVRKLKSYRLHAMTKKTTQSIRIFGGSGPWK